MRSQRDHRKVLVLSLLLVLSSPLFARADCIALPSPKGARFDPLTGATLAFAGTVTDRKDDELTVSFAIERVWKGELRRNTTVLIVPGEGYYEPFQVGVAYVVVVYNPVFVFESANERLSSIGVQANCGTPFVTRVSNAKKILKALGGGRPPSL